jgi:hypothetical protein
LALEYPAPGAIGTWTSSQNATFAVYPSFAANAMSFAAEYGPQVRNLTDPTAFATALDAGPLHYSNKHEIPDALYIHNVKKAIHDTIDLFSCIH